ncbi:MAG: hypothetical protein HY540_08210 [Deltaproteobacteria bacterium]|nr:hypothetical protein [Deltaproteobacteria bacterium]
MGRWETIKTVLAIVLGMAVLGTGAYFLNKAFLQYNPSKPTAAKVRAMERWIPEKADAIVIADVHQLRSEPAVFPHMSDLIKKITKDQASADAMSLERTGLVALIAEFKEQQKPMLAYIMQGHFDRDTLIATLKKVAAENGLPMEEHVVAGTMLYTEKGHQPEFAFTFLDGEHAAFGNRTVLEDMIVPRDPQHKSTLANTESWVFGHVYLRDRLKKGLPPQFADLTEVQFASKDGKAVEAFIPSTSLLQAQAVELFLSGARAWMTLQNQEDAVSMQALNTIVFQSDGAGLHAHADLPALIELLRRQF